MASALRALRLAQRAPITQFLRQPTASSRVTPSAFTTRSYATPTIREARPDKPADQAEQGSEDISGSDPNMDPNMNGNYPDPQKTSALALKRQFRDPYADWWDPQERRNYGEPVHEDNDILGIFSPDVYTHTTPAWGLVQIGSFVVAFCTLLAVVSRYYPDKPSAPRTYPGGLEAELGGPRAVRARMVEDEETALD